MAVKVLTPLLPFQEEGVSLMKELDFRTLLADEMGLGKTLTSLTCAVRHKLWPCVVVCPASLKLHWQRQAMEHCDLESVILSGRRPKPKVVVSGLNIINYEILQSWQPYLTQRRPKLIIVDECHMIGSLFAKRTKAVRKLCHGVRHVIAISGTPFLNRPWELFPTLNILCPEEFSSAHAYGMTYCEAEFSFGRWRFHGARKTKQLHKELVRTCMVRRLKKDVLEQLPPKTRTVLPLEIDDRKEYERAEDDLISWLSEFDMAAARRAKHAEEYAKWTHLKKLACSLKLSSVVSWVKEYLSGTDGKLLLGIWHTDTTARLLQDFGKCTTVIDGSKTTKQREEAERRFKEDPDCRILIGNFKSAGVGLNFPGVDVGLVEIPWNPATCVQFEDRAHRMNSVRGVNVFYFVAHGTIEEKLCQINDRKMKISDAILDGVTRQDSSLTIYDQLLMAMKRERKPRL